MQGVLLSAFFCVQKRNIVLIYILYQTINLNFMKQKNVTLGGDGSPRFPNQENIENRNKSCKKDYGFQSSKGGLQWLNN